MSYANGIKGAIALAGTIVVLVGCGHSSKYRASLIALPSQVPESIGSHRFKLTELSDLPSRGDIQFLNEREGWLSNYNRLWHTSNGGRTWEVVYDVSSEIKAGYVRIQFANAETGWRSTIDTLERTADGGKSWEEVSVPFNSNAGTIHSMRFLPDGKRGWLTGGVYRSLKPSQYGEFRHAYLSDGGTKVLQGTVFYTDDSGQSWRRQELDTKLGTLTGDVTVSPTGRVWTTVDYDLFYLDGDIWTKVDYSKCRGDNKLILETVVTGNAQRDRYIPLSIDFIDESHGWLTFSNGSIAKTIDGGKTWCDLSTLKTQETTNDQRLYVYFVDASNGLALAGDSELYETTDGGITWGKITSDGKIDDVYYDGQNMWAASVGCI